MQKTFMAVVLASAVSLSACATDSRQAGDIAQGAAIGAAGGAAVGAVVPGVNVIEGAAVGAAIGGLAGAVWADQNNDGYVDGYVSNGQYYAGPPGLRPDASPRRDRGPRWRSARRSCRRGDPGVSLLEGAVIGAAVGGVAGAIWADREMMAASRLRLGTASIHYSGAPAAAPAPTVHGSGPLW